MSANDLYPIPPAFAGKALVDADSYETLYRQSIENPERFWDEQGRQLQWIRPYTEVRDVSFDKRDLHIRWFGDGFLNAADNCIDRHLPALADQPALLWEPDTEQEAEGAAARTLTYQQLRDQVNRLANGLRSLGVDKGDVVTIYLPMVPEAVIAMLACARIGAVHSVVFGGFSPEALAGRIRDCGSKVVLTADGGLRGGRLVPLKANVDEALSAAHHLDVGKVVVLRHVGNAINRVEGRDLDWQQLVAGQSVDCVSAVMNAEDPLFILYTSGSTGQPKGVLHTTGGYLLYAAMTHRYTFDYRPGDVYWCTADVGWITGHSYMVYGPLCNGATQVIYEGVPNFPDCGRFARIVDKYRVNQLYTAPTLIRSLMAEGDAPVAGADLSTLRLLGSVGAPINPEAWLWYHRQFGQGRCPIVDTWWQTETGGFLITPLPGATPLKPGSATKPFFGIQPGLMDADGNLLDGAAAGNLVILDSWPGQMRTVFGDHQRFIDTYFSAYPGCYFSSDGARRDEDGYYWITGRVDDVLNVSGHRLGTAEIESALVAHPRVAEAAVVGRQCPIKGEGIYAYVTLNQGEVPSEALRLELRNWLRHEIGPIATPDVIQWAPGLPKTRSGKIMRRILRKIAAHEEDQLGDISTLADPQVVRKLVQDAIPFRA